MGEGRLRRTDGNDALKTKNSSPCPSPFPETQAALQQDTWPGQGHRPPLPFKEVPRRQAWASAGSPHPQLLFPATPSRTGPSTEAGVSWVFDQCEFSSPTHPGTNRFLYFHVRFVLYLAVPDSPQLTDAFAEAVGVPALMTCWRMGEASRNQKRCREEEKEGEEDGETESSPFTSKAICTGAQGQIVCHHTLNSMAFY